MKRLDNTTLPATDVAAKEAFQQEVAELSRKMDGVRHMLSEVSNRMKHIKVAIDRIEAPSADLLSSYYNLNEKLRVFRTDFSGDNIKSRLDIDQPPTPARRLGSIRYEQGNSTAAPTGTHKMSFAIAKEEFGPLLDRIQEIVKVDLESLENQLEDADAPYTPGRAIKMID